MDYTSVQRTYPLPRSRPSILLLFKVSSHLFKYGTIDLVNPLHQYCATFYVLSTFQIILFPLNSSVIHESACNKIHKTPFGISSMKSISPLEFIYSNVWGPAPISSVDGFHYYLILVDHFTKYVWPYPMKKKSEVSQIFPKFKALVEKYFKKPIVSFYSDNGGEFIHLKDFFSSNGVSHFLTPPSPLSIMVLRKDAIGTLLKPILLFFTMLTCLSPLVICFSDCYLLNQPTSNTST